MDADWREWLAAILATLTVAVALPLTTFLVSAWLLGWQLQDVRSGSMASTYAVGSLLVVEPIDASRVEVGMAVVFEDPGARGRLVTHRVVGHVPGDELAFWTQGDANPALDPVAVPARTVRASAVGRPAIGRHRVLAAMAVAVRAAGHGARQPAPGD